MSNFKFRGFGLATLVRACCDESPDAIGKPYTYEILFHDKVSDGRTRTEFWSVNKTQREFGKLFKMSEDGWQHAMLTGTQWSLLSKAQYDELLNEWVAAA